MSAAAAAHLKAENRRLRCYRALVARLSEFCDPEYIRKKQEEIKSRCGARQATEYELNRPYFELWSWKDLVVHWAKDAHCECHTRLQYALHLQYNPSAATRSEEEEEAMPHSAVYHESESSVEDDDDDDNNGDGDNANDDGGDGGEGDDGDDGDDGVWGELDVSESHSEEKHDSHKKNDYDFELLPEGHEDAYEVGDDEIVVGSTCVSHFPAEIHRRFAQSVSVAKVHFAAEKIRSTIKLRLQQGDLQDWMTQKLTDALHYSDKAIIDAELRIRHVMSLSDITLATIQALTEFIQAASHNTSLTQEEISILRSFIRQLKYAKCVLTDRQKKFWQTLRDRPRVDDDMKQEIDTLLSERINLLPYERTFLLDMRTKGAQMTENQQALYDKIRNHEPVSDAMKLEIDTLLAAPPKLSSYERKFLEDMKTRGAQMTENQQALYDKIRNKRRRKC